MTKLEGPLRRELTLGRERYTLTITPEGLTLVPKGRRKGFELAWRAFIDGDAALAIALNASLANGPSSHAATKVAVKPAKSPLPPATKTTAATAKPAARRPRAA